MDRPREICGPAVVFNSLTIKQMKIFLKQNLKNVKSKLYHVENSKIRGQQCRSR